MKKTTSQSAFRQSLIAASVAACFSFSSQQAGANPTGGTVVAGSASFAASGNSLTIANSANTVINWQGFSIGINEITRFLQSSPDSAVLNRVIGANGVIPQSVIDGMLQSNGRVFLINPMGIVIGRNATIDVAGLVASSLNLSNEDFLSGRMRFTEVPGAAGVANNGSIQVASGGRVFLVAPSVENNGIIKAPQGEILLAAGKSAELVNEGTPLVTVRITADSEQALNVGQLVADSGRIGMYGALVRNSGIAEANGAVAGPGGSIRFVAERDVTLDAGSVTRANGASGGDVVLQAKGGTNLVAGTVEAKGASRNGGSVDALGVRVGVIGKGVIDASGDTGGGTVRIGGDYHGSNAAVQNAERTLIGSDGVIRADAGTSGNGGRVIVWADDETRFYGSISARGGASSGNGGFVETSAPTLIALGNVNLAAPKGKGGTWLLDPFDLNIVSGTAPIGFATCGVNEICFDDGPSYGTSLLSLGAMQSALSSYGSITAAATHNINLQTNLTLAYAGTGGTVTAYAGNNINLGSFNVSLSRVNLQAFAGDDGSGSGSATGSITSNPGFGNISTNGGSVTASGYNITVGDINTTGASSFDTSVRLTAQNSISVGNVSTGATTGSSVVDMRATYGSVVTGSITTGATAVPYGSTFVTLESSYGSVVTGNVATGSGGSNSAVSYYAGMNISAGQITTGNSQSGSGIFLLTDSVFVSGGTGSISAGDLTTGKGTFSPVLIESGGTVTTGNISATGGGSLSALVLAYGDVKTGAIDVHSVNPAYGGGVVEIVSYGGNVRVDGMINTRGADGNSAHPDGSYGGPVFISAPGSVEIGPTPTLGVTRTVIDTSGGAGASGGKGGDAGPVNIDPSTITFNGLVLAVGGAGGGAGGGNGGDLFFETTNGLGVVTFINGGYDASGGLGSPPGLNGTVLIDGSLVFVTLLSPLSDPTVAAAVGTTIKDLLDSTNNKSKQDDPTDPNDKKKKGGFSSCKA